MEQCVDDRRSCGVGVAAVLLWMAGMDGIYVGWDISDLWLVYVSRVRRKKQERKVKERVGSTECVCVLGFACIYVRKKG